MYLLVPSVASALFASLLAAAAANEDNAFITYSNHSAQDLVESYFRDPDGQIQFRNVASSSHSCFALFDNGHSAGRHKHTGQFLLPNKGIIMSTGNPEDFHINDSDETSTNFGLATGDISLEHELPSSRTQVLDPCFIEFEFSCPGETDIYTPVLRFDYIFGSEEYFKQQEQQTTDTTFNDVFGFFLNGENIALVPDKDNTEKTPLVVSINNVNEQENSELFVNNKVEGRINATSPYSAIEADGFTTKLTAEGFPREGWNIIKIAIGDVADGELDSWVLLESGTFSCAPSSIAASIRSTSAPTTPSSAPTPIPPMNQQSQLRSSSPPTSVQTNNLPASQEGNKKDGPLIPKPVAISLMVSAIFFLLLVPIMAFLICYK